MNDIIPAGRPYQITPTGLLFSETITLEEWVRCGDELWVLKQAAQWAIGDWILKGEHKFGETYAQALDETKYSYGYLRNVVLVARRFPREKRVGAVSWSHHAAVAKLDDEASEDLLLRAAEEGLNRDQTRVEAKRVEAVMAGDIQIIEPLPAVRVEALVEDCSTLSLHLPLKPEWVGKEVLITIKEAA